MNRILVLGADGFIGRHMTKALAETGNKVVAFDRFSSYKDKVSRPFTNLKNVKVITGDFLNHEQIASALDNIDYVFHLVSTTTPATSLHNPLIDIETNVQGTINLLSLCAKKGVTRVVFPSSGGTVYGEIDSGKISETTLPQPTSPYGIGKLTIEHFLRYFKNTANLDYIVYRIANPYGPGQNVLKKQGVIPIFLQHYQKNEPITIFGNGSMVRDYIYIDDVIRLIALTYDQSHRYSEYNIGSGHGTSVNELIDMIEKVTGKSVKRAHIPTPLTYVHRSVLDTSRFSNEFALNPVINLHEGISETWKYASG